MRLLTCAVLALFVDLAPLAASPAAAQSPAARDTAFNAMQERGKQAMGVDAGLRAHAGRAGAKVMRAMRGKIAYQVHDPPRGAELHMTTTDPEAVAAIRAFMALQRGEHHAGGMDGMKHTP